MRVLRADKESVHVISMKRSTEENTKRKTLLILNLQGHCNQYAFKALPTESFHSFVRGGTESDMDRNHHYYKYKYKIAYCIHVLDSASQSGK